MTDDRQQAVSLAFRDVTKRYPGQERAAVENLTLDVPAGDVCVLVGPSGCGKTTAMRMVNRLIEPTSGDILLGDRSVLDRRPAELRREIGYAIQQVGLFPHQTIADNIATVPKLLGWPKDRIRARVDELLELVSLDPEITRDRYPSQLSGGQRQRVGVARALAADPPVLLMDEPFGAIDPITRERLQNELLRLQQVIKKTIVFVTHDIDEAIKMGDRIAVMQEGGHLAQYATPAELLMRPETAFVEQFVGADRALKRLALARVRDIDLWSAARVRPGGDAREAREAVAASDLPHAMLVDADGRPLGWVRDDQLHGQRVPFEPSSRPHPLVDLDDVLRDALADLLLADTQYAPVIDAHGHVAGVLSIEAIGHALGRAASDGAEDAAAADTPGGTQV